MNIFLKKIALIGSVFGLCLLCLNYRVSTSKKRYAGNPVYALKHDFFIQNQDQFNAIALGSSLTYRHLIPETFDASLNTCKTTTFNLGADGMFNPETYYLYENLLNEIPADSLDYVFLEIETIQNIKTENLATARNYYWHSLRYWLFSTKYTLDSAESSAIKLEQVKEYSISYLYRLLLGFRVLFAPLPNQSLDLVQDGFYAFDAQMNNPQTEEKERNRLIGKYDALQQDTSVLQERAAIAQKTFSAAEDSAINQAHLRKLLHLLEKSEEKGVELIFFVPPRLHTYRGLASVVEKLPSDRVVEVFDPVKYPELYQLELSFDEIHLTEEGAEIFSRYFAEAVGDVCVDK